MGNRTATLEISNFRPQICLSLQDQLRERVGIITLGYIDEGTLFKVISTSRYIVGEGENMREDILSRVAWARKERQELYKKEDMILPKMFLPQLKGDRFPVIRRFSGKHNTECGAKMYHDIQIMKPNDKRLQMSPLCIEYGTQLSSFDVLWLVTLAVVRHSLFEYIFVLVVRVDFSLCDLFLVSPMNLPNKVWVVLFLLILVDCDFFWCLNEWAPNKLCFGTSELRLCVTVLWLSVHWFYLSIECLPISFKKWAQNKLFFWDQRVQIILQLYIDLMYTGLSWVLSVFLFGESKSLGLMGRDPKILEFKW